MEIVWTDALVLWTAALTISFFTSMSGVSGAFLLLPFQAYYFGIISPSISGTNHIFNIIATPGGIYHYAREGRMLWSLVLPLVVGSIPGVIAGAWIRIRYLPDAQGFKLFAGVVLLAVAIRLLWDILLKNPEQNPESLECEAPDIRFSYFLVSIVAAVVGLVGGIYGVGGGVFIAPFILTVFRLPVRTIAGATLFCTLVTSTMGALSFEIFANLQEMDSYAPDWKTGIVLGLGGLAGTYLGARCQKYFPVAVIKGVLGSGLIIISIVYVISGLLSSM